MTMNTVFGQNFNFPDSNAIWSVYDEKYFVAGDSSFNFINYKKYYFTNDSIVATGTFFALLREDTITEQVFSISSDSIQEHLLYDFSLGVNDTATVFPLAFYLEPIRIIVDQIDSILINGQYHKRLKVLGLDQNTNIHEYWIEGIGSTFGLFNSGITGIVVFDITYPELICFEKDGVIIYNNPKYISCYEPYPIGIYENQIFNRVRIYPNPTRHTLTIESDYKIHSYQLFSSIGKEIEKKVIFDNFHSIDISNYPSGVYFINITHSKGNVMKKIIIETAYNKK